MDKVSSCCGYVGSLGMRGVSAVVRVAIEALCVQRQNLVEVGGGLFRVDLDGEEVHPFGCTPEKPKKT